MAAKTPEISPLKDKLLDIEEHAIHLKTINNILESYTAENSPEGLIISGLISKELDEIFLLLDF